MKTEFLKIIRIIFTGLFLYRAVCMAQPNCSAPSTGFVPINDLGKATFTNAWNVAWQGGLYPGGSNFLPSVHKNAGMQLASEVRGLDAKGNPDLVNGKIVWLSIGMSNTTQETQQFIPLANAFQNKNSKLIPVDGAQGGMTAAIVATPSHSNYNTFWTTVGNRLTNAGVTSSQVQVIWLKEADVAGNTPIRQHYDSLVVRNKRILIELKKRFPNLKLCYLSSRISGRYASSTLNPEPYAYYSGWAVKKVIEDQINGDSQLKYSGPGANVPWIAWGPYMWSDGITTQATNPKVFWTCPADFQSDGTHPSSPTGARKAGNFILDFFSTDSTAMPWFLKTGTTSVSSVSEKGSCNISIFPNPFNEEATLQTGSDLKNANLTIYTPSGQKIKLIKNISGNTFKLDRGSIPGGLYIIRLTQQSDLISTGKIAVLK